MNDFERQIAGISSSGLYASDIETIQVNVGLRCNQECTHCHLNSSPRRTEMMAWPTMELALETARSVGCPLMDLTGGSPELNPHFRRFVEALRKEGHFVQVRTNLTVLLEPGMETMPEFLRDHEVQLVASIPCYLEENVRAQRGEGVLELPVNHGAPDHIRRFDRSDLLTRRIVTGEHCFGCTAGFGSSCGGALVN